MERILIHACCAHCLGKTLAGLKTEPVAYEPTIFWGNPNIHPLIEWRRRLKAVKMLAERAKLIERNKELACLYEIAKIVANTETTFAEVVRRGSLSAAASRCGFMMNSLISCCPGRGLRTA